MDMCGRYCIDWEDHPEELLRIVAALDGKMSPEDRAKVKTSGEIFPTDIVPVLAGKQVVPMQWGFSLDGSRRVINARAETVGQKSLFRGALNAARCLIPASGYYEWHKSADAPSPSAGQKYLLRDREPTLYMAALYRREPGNPFPTFVILTRSAASSVAFLHDRMPVLFRGEARREWLLGTDPEALLREAQTVDPALQSRPV